MKKRKYLLKCPNGFVFMDTGKKTRIIEREKYQRKTGYYYAYNPHSLTMAAVVREFKNLQLLT